MPPPRHVIHIVATMVLLATLILCTAVPSHARSELERTAAERVRITRSVRQVRHAHWRRIARLRGVIGTTTRHLRQMPGPGAAANPERYRHVQRELRQQRWLAAERLERSGLVTSRRIRALRARVRAVDAWLETWGVFRSCPIAGWHSVADNFGITVRLPDVPVHRHMGNDITASSGTPIVAPFDGYASASSSVLGGLEVRVQGAPGYVYNAHLSSYGTLGDVSAGTVIGYVGATGDATAPHDHFEWHPLDGVAVDPHPLLSVSCDGS